MLHIDLPTRAEIETLLAHRGAPTVSIYLATTPVTQDAQADRIELKNLLKAAVAEMEAGDTAKRAIWPIEAGGGRGDRRRRLLGGAGEQPGDLRHARAASAPSACRTG